MATDHIVMTGPHGHGCQSLHQELARVLNMHGIDTLTGTPDFILATLLVNTLENYRTAIVDTRAFKEGGPFEKKDWDKLDKGTKLNQKIEDRLNQKADEERSSLCSDEPLPNIENPCRR